MLKDVDTSSYRTLISTGETVWLSEAPTEQLQQTLCDMLAYLQQAELKAQQVVRTCNHLRGLPAPDLQSQDYQWPTQLCSLYRYAPELFNVNLDDGTVVAVQNLDRKALLQWVARGMDACVAVDDLYRSKLGRWAGHRPAPTIGHKLRLSLDRAATLPKPDHLGQKRMLGLLTTVDNDLKINALAELGLFEAIKPADLNTALPLALDDVEEMGLQLVLIEAIENLK